MIKPEDIARLEEKLDMIFDPANNIISNLDRVSAKQHSRAQASLYKLVKQLLNLGVIHYNKEQHLYYLTKKEENERTFYTPTPERTGNNE